VFGAPTVGFFLLWRNIHKDANNPINQYLLILYQGLKQNRFYWEFINTSRKVLILMSFALGLYVRILASATILIISIRLQIWLKPYKKEQYNELEIWAVSAGIVTLLAGLSFEIEGSVSYLNAISLVFIFLTNLYFFVKWGRAAFTLFKEQYKLKKVSNLN
jgi:hypothetical protein